ncbi:MAG: hypothetical protein ACM3OH_11385 [Bacillota bacterium]|jgi:hypothetical protein
MKIARWIGALAVVAGAACTAKANTDGTGTTTTTTAASTSAPCTVTDSVSGTTAPCFMSTYDSVSGSTARTAMNVSAVVREGGRAIPLSALTAACRDVSTGAVVSCSLGLMLGSSSPPKTMQSAESVSGTPGRDSTK